MVWTIFILIFLLLAVLAPKLLFFRSDVHRLPGPTPIPLVGSLFIFSSFSPEAVIPYIQKFQTDYGNLFLFWIGFVPVVNVISADGAEVILSSKTNIKKGRAYNLLEPWLGRGLLTSEGGRWLSHRKLITPTFHFSILETFLGIFQEHANTLVERLAKDADEGPVKLQPFITKCTLDVICEAAMGLKVGAQCDALSQRGEADDASNKYIKSVLRISQLTVKRILNPVLRAPFIFFRTKMGKSYRRHLDTIHRFANQVITSRITSGITAADKRRAFLDLLLEARDQDGSPLSQQDIREEVDTFMFEGHDTTAAAILWILYLLGRHPVIQEEIYQEVTEVLPSSDTPVTTAHLSQMKTLDRAIKEALRLYPSVPNILRTITEEIEIEGYRIPVGASLIVHIYQLHRDPNVFPEPEKFDPDRFLPENSLGRHPFAYIPFSAGPRNCIGQKFAMLEEKVLLATVLRKFRVEFVGEFNAQAVRSELTLRPPRDLTFLLKQRVTNG